MDSVAVKLPPYLQSKYLKNVIYLSFNTDRALPYIWIPVFFLCGIMQQQMVFFKDTDLGAEKVMQILRHERSIIWQIIFQEGSLKVLK